VALEGGYHSTLEPGGHELQPEFAIYLLCDLEPLKFSIFTLLLGEGAAASSLHAPSTAQPNPNVAYSEHVSFLCVPFLLKKRELGDSFQLP
jgi:hypothetical protein